MRLRKKNFFNLLYNEPATAYGFRFGAIWRLAPNFKFQVSSNLDSLHDRDDLGKKLSWGQIFWAYHSKKTILKLTNTGVLSKNFAETKNLDHHYNFWRWRSESGLIFQMWQLFAPKTGNFTCILAYFDC